MFQNKLEQNSNYHANYTSADNSFDRMNNQNNRYCRYLRLLLRKFYVFLINYYKIY